MTNNTWEQFTEFSHQSHGKDTDSEIPSHNNHCDHYQKNLWPTMLGRMLEKRKIKTKTRIALGSSSNNSRYPTKVSTLASHRNPYKLTCVLHHWKQPPYRAYLDDHQCGQRKQAAWSMELHSLIKTS